MKGLDHHIGDRAAGFSMRDIAGDVLDGFPGE